MHNFSKIAIILLLFTLKNHDLSVSYKMKIHHYQHPKLAQFQIQDEINEKGVVTTIQQNQFITNMVIGLHPVFLVFDTGSRFTWVQSKSCKECLPFQSPMRDPFEGSRYFLLKRCSHTGNDCEHRNNTPGSQCQGTLCTYKTDYADTTRSIGFVASDTVQPFNNEIRQIMVFGVGSRNTCKVPQGCYQGVAGFGASPLSIPYQLSPRPNRWAFCLSLNESMDGAFMVGDEAQIYGDYETAPLIHDLGYYQMTLSEIFVIGSGRVMGAFNGSTILIDTGATLSYLEDWIFENLVSFIIARVDEVFKVPPLIAPNLSELCYEKPHNVDIMISFGDAFIMLGDRLWWQHGYSVYCLSFRRSGSNILGNYHLRGYKVVFDIDPQHPVIQISASQEEPGCFTPVF